MKPIREVDIGMRLRWEDQMETNTLPAWATSRLPQPQTDSYIPDQSGKTVAMGFELGLGIGQGSGSYK